MIRAYFIKPAPPKPDIAKDIFVGLAMCIKKIGKNSVTGNVLGINPGQVFPYYEEEGKKILISMHKGRALKGSFNNKDFNFEEYFVIGEKEGKPEPEELPEGMVYCKSEYNSSAFHFNKQRFYHIYRKYKSAWEIFNNKMCHQRCTKGQFLDHFVIHEEDNKSNIDKISQELKNQETQDSIMQKASEMARRMGNIQKDNEPLSEGDLISGELKIPEDLNPERKAEFYECVKWCGLLFNIGKVYENQTQELTLEEMEDGFICLIAEDNTLQHINPYLKNKNFKLAI